MPILDHLEPRAVFSCFEQLCAIPHGSGNTKAISDYLVRFAAEHQLRCIQDAHNNVIIFAPGTPGYETAAPVILQGHMDMVCEKNSDVEFDFDNDPIRTQVSAISVGVVDGRPVLDLNYVEDSGCGTDMNVVMTGEGGFVEIQGTAEGAPFTEAELTELLRLARKGNEEIQAAQRSVFEEEK